jgi:5-hydroxyisourate hydrolase
MTDVPVFSRRGLVAGAMVAAPGLAMAQPAPQPGNLSVAPVSQAGLGPRLTMHAIDTYHGTPGVGLSCELGFFEGEDYRPVKTVVTAANGRTAEPLLVDDALKPGRYQLLMSFGDYFRKWQANLPSPSFLDLVPVRFIIQDARQRYHLPVLFSPWGYSYYRGS